jgi:hypothetical protein
MDLKKELGGVADAVTKIMMGEKALHPNQQKLDVHEPEKDELTADDFKKLRAGKKPAEVKKEEVELTKEEAEMLASLSQEEFNSLTEEEQDLFIEYFQPLDEISTGAAKNYLKKAVPSSSKLNQKSAKPGEDKASESNYMDMDAPYETKEFQKFSKRRTGIRKAITKLASAHPDNKKLATTARQAFNKIHNANYRIGMDGAKNTPNDVKHVKQQHSIIHKAVNAMKEDVDQAAKFVLEYESKDGKFVHRAKPGVYGGTKDEKHAVDTLKGPKMKELSDIEAEKKKKKKMSEMVATYQEQGLKGLFASLVKEEPDNETFTKEVEAQKAKNAGEGKKAEVAKAAVQAVQNEVNGVRISEIDLEERQMTEPEMKKKEEIVKSMKKGIAGFKERYGSRAKNVMYATATKRAMGEEVEQIDEAVTHGDYTITHKPYNGTDKQRHVSNDITHAYSTNQKKLGIKYSKDEDEIGPDRHITVKNNKTGEVSHHVATHNNTYKDEHEKQKISIRAHGEITPHDDKHAKVIKSFLTQKS